MHLNKLLFGSHADFKKSTQMTNVPQIYIAPAYIKLN